MAKFGKYNVRMKKSYNFMDIIIETVKFVLYLLVGGMLLVQVGEMLNLTGNPFIKAFNLLGYTDDADGTASIASTSLVGIVGIMGAIYLIVKFVDIKRVG